MVFEHIELNSLDDFFVPLSKRSNKGVFFYRINGISDQVHTFLTRYFDAARKGGVIIEGKIPNPTDDNLSYYNEMMGMDFQLSVGFIASSLKKWLPRMNDSQRETVAIAIYDSLDGLRQSGKTENILKNAYIKFMCWLYYKFERIVNQLGSENVPKILYEGIISNYELLLVSILSNSGCDVILVQKEGDAGYLKVDANSSKSILYNGAGLKSLPSDFSLKKLREEAEQAQKKERLYGSMAGVINCTNAWIEGNPLQDILEAPVARGKEPNMFYNCYCRMNGAQDKLTYVNELYQFQLALKNAKRHLVIVNELIEKPRPEEIMRIKRGNYANYDQLIANLQANIQTSVGKDLQAILVKAFVDVLTEESKLPDMNVNKLTNKAVYLLCWLKRYQSDLFTGWKMPDVGCFIYMGGCKSSNEALFMRFLARTPVDVLILCPNLNDRCCLQDDILYEQNNQVSVVVNKFPEQNATLHIGTAAYHAERDLDQIMYSDSTIFRDQQFSKANTISLQTMDREVKILWSAELKYRPNFSTMDGVVNIPVVFSKFSGVKDKNIDEYWMSIKQLITPETIMIDSAPHITSTTPNPIKMYVTEFFKNGKLQRNRIKNHPSFQYKFLRDEMQEHILDKLEALIEQKLIRGTFENGTEYTIIGVALNLSKEILRLLQTFDFTKKNPKLIYVNASEELISLEDTILVTFLNLLGFDVVFFVPTGYNMENHFSKRLMEEHQIGEYLYDLQVPDWDNVPTSSAKGWVNKIFKRG